MAISVLLSINYSYSTTSCHVAPRRFNLRPLSTHWRGCMRSVMVVTVAEAVAVAVAVAVVVIVMRCGV